MSSKTIILLSGCPGSGKTTLAESLSHSLPALHIQIDAILSELGDFTVEKLAKARGTARDLLLQQCTRDFQYIIIDDTNHLKKLVKPYRKIAKNTLSRLLHIVMQIDLDVALARNSQRNCLVSPGTIENIHTTLSSESFFKHSVLLHTPSAETVLALLHFAPLQCPYSIKSPMTQSELHNSDLSLRTYISAVVKSSPVGQRQGLSQTLSSAKKLTLKYISSCRPPYPPLLPLFNSFLGT